VFVLLLLLFVRLFLFKLGKPPKKYPFTITFWPRFSRVFDFRTQALPRKLVLKDPVNHPYHHMRLTVFFGFGFPFLLQWLGNTSLTLQPLLLMVIFFLSIQSVLLAITGSESTCGLGCRIPPTIDMGLCTL
jgi:hypothetical protein